MRHERISRAAARRLSSPEDVAAAPAVDHVGIAAAAWPSGFEGLVVTHPGAARHVEPAEAEAPAVATPAPAVPDVPAAVGGLVAGTYAAMVAIFFALFSGSAEAVFSLVVVAGFVAIFFAVPRIFLAVEADPSRRPTMNAFMHEGMETLTGRTTGRDALVQMLIVPVLLAFALIAMGIAGMIYL